LERLRFGQGVHLLVERDKEHKDARVRAVVYDHPKAGQHTTQLAASLGVPVRLDSGAPVQQATPSGTAS
jgi:hypothetical protein